MSKKLIKKLALVGVISMFSMSSLTGCVKPYNKPVFETIEANETAFLIPLIGDTSEQGVFESEKLLSETKVATKEVQIPRRWVQKGRLHWQGEYRDSATVIKVNRSPITREWTSDKDTGTTSGNQGVTAKTKDGIKIILNVNATAQIDEALATKYLYYYNKNDLSQVMDTEIKTMVHSRMIEEVGKISLDELNTEKIMATVKPEVQEYFKNRGVTITALGFSSDPNYPKDVQEAMNKKVTAKQQQEAQSIANKTAEDKAKSEALQAKLQQETLQSQLKLKELEIKQTLANKWDGKTPVVQGGENSILDLSSIVQNKQ